MATTETDPIQYISTSGCVARWGQEGQAVGGGDTLLLSERALAQKWGCSVKKLQADRASGRGPAYVKIGRLVRYPLDKVLAYEQARLHVPTSVATGS